MNQIVSIITFGIDYDHSFAASSIPESLREQLDEAESALVSVPTITRTLPLGISLPTRQPSCRLVSLLPRRPSLTSSASLSLSTSRRRSRSWL